jgi:lipopolysaccharide transport system ATP-binding protein
MTDIAIRAEHLGKRYHRVTASPGLAMRERLERLMRQPVQRAVALAGAKPAREAVGPPHSLGGERWALRDVSFEVRHGEVVGVVGANGAGKSGLLKILARVTRPTTGRAEIHGRVGAMLEVGTGFHPELTGRENVYLNGALLGMTRAEITRKFEAIVAFAELAEFMETPVKWYSSGMSVRLAFAVAAHLEPEILLIDEVLAVGDEGFQQKCLAQLREIVAEGRTILLVSHQVRLIADLCDRVLMLDHGRLVLDGTPQVVLAHYLAGDA